MGWGVTGLEAGKRALEIEGRVGGLRPTAQSEAVLKLLNAPALDIGKRLGARIAEHAPEVDDVVVGSVLDERSGLHRRQQTGRDFRAVKAAPLDVIQRPPRTIDGSRTHPALSQSRSKARGPNRQPHP